MVKMGNSPSWPHPSIMLQIVSIPDPRLPTPIVHRPSSLFRPRPLDQFLIPVGFPLAVAQARHVVDVLKAAGVGHQHLLPGDEFGVGGEIYPEDRAGSVRIFLALGIEFEGLS